jgi:uncharacterized spore protein YtfJ
MAEERRTASEVFQKTFEATKQINQKLVEVASPKAVFSEPVISGEYTVITASEVFTAVGSGFGFGSAEGEADEVSGEEMGEIGPMAGSGGGGGGGGAANGRPVALITIGPRGVEVEPVVDVTKLGLALLTTLGSMAFMLRRMKRG